MEENSSLAVLDGEIVGIRFGLTTYEEIHKASVSGCPVTHASQLTNPFLGLPLEFGKCESCGTSEPGKCEGHFGYIQLPIPIYHPSHVSELRQMLSLLCLRCLRMRNKSKVKNAGVAERLFSLCCEEVSQVSIKEGKTPDDACYLQLKLPSRSRPREGFWNFLEKYGFRYGYGYTRTLLPCEVMKMIRSIPEDTRRKLAGKGYFPQDGYILQVLPVPPNCLSVPDISDGVSTMSSDPSTPLLKKVLEKVENIKSSRCGEPNFESHSVEANELQSAVNKYLQARGTAKASREDTRYGVSKNSNDCSTKAWLEKMRTLFIRKGSGFSSRSVITGDPYKKVNEIGIPFEIAQRITFEERVNLHNMKYLQELVDKKLCLTYRDGGSTYSLREGSKGHTFLRPGQVVHRRIMDGDTVFINRPPTTHKHSLQALSVYIHDDHTVKINPLICGPLSADFDGDCVHLFYPQSPAARAEVLELFSVEKQLLSSHSGNLNLQLAADSLLSLKVMFEKFFLGKTAAQQLAMFGSLSLLWPALFKSHSSGSFWTASQIIQTALPACFDCNEDRYLIRKSEILNIDFNKDSVQSVVGEVVNSIFYEKGPKEVLEFFASLQPLLMENLFVEGFSVGLKDFSMPKSDMQAIQKLIHDTSLFLSCLGSTYNEELQLENRIRCLKETAENFIIKSSLRNLIDFRSDSAVNKVVQQIGFLGLQLSDKGKFYSKNLVEDVAFLFRSKHPGAGHYPSANFGLIKSCFIHGLDPYEEMAHSISTREVIVRSSRGLTEPGTLFKNMMAVLRDIIVCYDGTVRNICSNSVIQFKYGLKADNEPLRLFPAGEPVGVLAATAMSNPAYKAVLDSTPSSNSSWELMKEILLSKISFKNDLNDRRVILYLNDCNCARRHCQEKAACLVRNQLNKVTLKDAAVQFLVEYKNHRTVSEGLEIDAGLAGHVHLNKTLLQVLNIDMQEILQQCRERISLFRKKKKVGHCFKKIILSVSKCCSFQQSCEENSSDLPCLIFCWHDTSDIHLERTSYVLANMIYPVLLETVIKGDPRICSANIIWASPDTMTWIRKPSRTRKGEWVLDVVVEKSMVKRSGDAWRIVMDSCLPVFHLIDSRRSIPYSTKQVQELLGISCAFDQAVQRLSTSVAMVAKGVLREHLILLANSMTCAGNLVGFNPGGYKAISRSLNIQAPFMEATLFTPRKCFERAAEKCHTDSLSSVVGSCSWGKNVAVGTGSRFDVLWDTKEARFNEGGKLDVYTFLHMVRSSSHGEDLSTACLGEEIDDLVPDEETFDWSPSPEHYSTSGKPVFEDGEDILENLETQPTKPSWEHLNNGRADLQKQSSWSSWSTDRAHSQDVCSTKTLEECLNSAGGTGVIGSDKTNLDSQNTWANWNTKGSYPTKASEDSPKSCGWVADKCGSGETNAKGEHNWSNWTAVKGGSQDFTATKTWEESSKAGGWGSKKSGNGESNVGEGSPWSNWKTNKGNSQGTHPQKAQEESSDFGGWGSNKFSRCETNLKEQSTWSKWNSNKGDNQDAYATMLENNDNDTGKEKGWSSWARDDSINGSVLPEGDSSKSNGLDAGTVGDGSWEQTPTGTSDGWGVLSESTEPAGCHGWGLPNNEDITQNESQGRRTWEFSKKKRNEGSRGWSSNSGDWKGKKNLPGKLAGNVKDDFGAGRLYTHTRQRLDMFTSEEQDVLSDVEPLMQSIRRIMHQSGYNDGDPLSVDDQSFVIDKVFMYHPDRAVKMGAGIDFVTVSRHSNFQDSRCFYIVSTDGRKQDFSYRKCLDNFIKGKYPDIAEQFIGKYFRKPRSSGNQQKPVLEETENMVS